jgi:phage baseplate assembly protein gpV
MVSGGEESGVEEVKTYVSAVPSKDSRAVPRRSTQEPFTKFGDGAYVEVEQFSGEGCSMEASDDSLSHGTLPFFFPGAKQG